MSKRVFCGLPWYSMQLHLDGQYGPCCHIKIPNENTPASVDELMTLFNSETMQQIRSALFSGKTTGLPCHDCYDRYFDTDHDIFGMGEMLPRYSLHGKKFDERYNLANRHYCDGDCSVSKPPLELYAYTSEACNLKCRVCVQNRNTKLFPVNKIIKIIKEIGWDHIDRFGFVGGEPLLTKDGIELLSFLSEERPVGTCIYITTNGTLLHEQIEKIDKIDNLFLSISIEGFGKVYETMRVNAEWNVLINNLMILKEYHQHHPNWRLNIYSIVMKSTLPYLIDVLKLAELFDATIFYNREVTGYKTENFFVNPEVLPIKTIINVLDKAVEYAVNVGAVKAVDSLRKIQLYLLDCRSKLMFQEKYIESRLGKLKDNPFVIYGTGGHTDKLLAKYDLISLDLRAFADSDEQKWGKEYSEKEIIPPETIPDYASIVLISSEEYESQIFQTLIDLFQNRIEIITLYQ